MKHISPSRIIPTPQRFSTIAANCRRYFSTLKVGVNNSWWPVSDLRLPGNNCLAHLSVAEKIRLVVRGATRSGKQDVSSDLPTPKHGRIPSGPQASYLPCSVSDIRDTLTATPVTVKMKGKKRVRTTGFPEVP
jgi:hypothetical protein